jgi:hypothetical protein
LQALAFRQVSCKARNFVGSENFMLHHLSIAVGDPERVAKVLAEIMGGSYRPFPPNKGSFFAFQQDEYGTMVEIHSAGTILIPEGSGFDKVKPSSPNYGPTHFAISIKKSIEEVSEIAKREGWLCRRNDRAAFPVLEFWIENALMCEFLPPEFAQAYLRIAAGPPPGSGDGPPPGGRPA